MVVDYENAWIYTEQPFYLKILVILSASSTGLQIYQMVDSTSVENISCKRENLRVENVESLQNPIGKSITDQVPN